jgi:hypothetical protein
MVLRPRLCSISFGGGGGALRRPRHTFVRVLQTPNDPERINSPGRCWYGARKRSSEAEALSRGEAVDARYLEQISELLARIEHPGFHGTLGNSDDRADLFH